MSDSAAGSPEREAAALAHDDEVNRTMNPIRTVMAATDLSPSARHAAARAAMLAAECDARLTLVHVLDSRVVESVQRLSGQLLDTRIERIRSAAAESLSRLAEGIQRRYGVTAEVRSVTGEVLPELVRAAEDWAADLVVLGAHGAGFARELLLGSTTERLLRLGTRPVLVVKQIPHEPYRKTLLAVDESPRSAAVPALAKAVAPSAERILLHVFEIPFERKLHYAGFDDIEMMDLRLAAQREASERLEDWSRQCGIRIDDVDRILLPGQPGERILDQERDQDCDLIVIGRHGASRLPEWLLGSVTKYVLALSSADVLVVGAPRNGGPAAPR